MNESRVNEAVINYYTSSDLILEYSHTGSREICSPPPEDTDDDYIVLVDQDKLPELEKVLTRNKWLRGGSLHELSSSPYEGSKVDRTCVFSSWKKDPEASVIPSNLNLILTISPEFYQNFKLATNLAKRLNLLDKQKRIDLFNAIVYDEFPT